jgi:hypothetical protein
MAHRDYGLGETKPPPTVGGPLPSDAWSGRAIIAGVAVVLIVLGQERPVPLRCRFGFGRRRAVGCNISQLNGPYEKR